MGATLLVHVGLVGNRDFFAREDMCGLSDQFGFCLKMYLGVCTWGYVLTTKNDLR